MSTEVQLDFATMALKGKRYDEAERIYSELANSDSSAEAWMGLGITKLYQVANGRTMDETIFCFNKAKTVDQDQASLIEDQLIIHAQIVLQAYGKVVDDALVKFEADQKRAGMAMLVTAASVVVGSNSHSAYGTIASLGATGAGVSVAVDSFAEMGDIKTMVQRVLGKCDEVNNGVKGFVDTTREEYKKFEEFVNDLLSHLRISLDPKKRKKALKEKAHQQQTLHQTTSTANSTQAVTNKPSTSTAIVSTGNGFNHTLHIVLSVLTGGVWLVGYGFLYWRHKQSQ